MDTASNRQTLARDAASTLLKLEEEEETFGSLQRRRPAANVIVALSSISIGPTEETAGHQPVRVDSSFFSLNLFI